MRKFWTLALVGLWATGARAADKPVIAPAPDWVKMVANNDGSKDGKSAAAKTTGTATPEAEGGAAIRLLLSDTQVKLEAGRMSAYSASVLRIQTPQGLAAGNISFSWRPETDEVIVHKLLIRRGDQVIDVLASGQTFTVVRRETNLESATLDGVLTANIQPEGLQVGDILEIAATTISSDPVLKGHVEMIGGAWNGFQIDHAHLRVAWNGTLPVRIQPSAALAMPKVVKAKDFNSFDLDLHAIEPLPTPKLAPPRFAIGRMIEVSDYASWADVSALLAPLYDKAATLPDKGPLADEAQKIRALPDAKARAEAALRLVEDRIRYVALAMGTGGLVPADAETSWSRRYGDCKAKTALLLALLRNAGIRADPVAVNAVSGDGIDERLPMIGLFNHVLVRAEIDGRIYWLDGTRTGDRKLDHLKTPYFGWGLPLLASGGTLVRMLPPPLDKPTDDVKIRIDATAGISLPAPTSAEITIYDDQAYATNLTIANLSPDARDRMLRDFWHNRYDFIDIKSVSASFDADKREERLTMTGDARMDWTKGRYETDGSGVGFHADFERDPGTRTDAPFQIAYPFYGRNVETILLPDAFRATVIPPERQIEQTVAGIEYRRKIAMTGNSFTVETSQRSILPEIPAKDAAAAQATLRALDDNNLYLYVPKSYRLTDKEVEARLAGIPKTAEEFATRGLLLLEQNRQAEGIADLGKALELDPSNVRALAGRALSHASLKENDKAEQDAAAALKIDPRNAVALDAKAMVADARHDCAAAVAAYSASLEVEPRNAFALARRAICYRSLGDDDHALEDIDATLKYFPKQIPPYLMKANILRVRGDIKGVAATAEALVAVLPESDEAQVTAGRIYAGADLLPEAMRAFDRAIAIKREAYIYVNRAAVRPKSDSAARRADLDEALRLDPTLEDALIAKARLEQDAGRWPEAVALLSKLVATTPGDPRMLVQRGIVYARAGQKDKAMQDFAAARSHADDAMDLNNICYEKATAGLDLEGALSDCDAAIAKRPGDAAIMDSRAFVLMRLGRIDDALAEYDRTLAKRPNSADVLFGRALAWSRKGDKTKSTADADAARKVDPKVDERFKRYGLSL